MRMIKATGLVLLGAVAALAGCDELGGGGGQALYVAVQHPPEFELPQDVKVVAVTPFTAQSREEKAYAETAVGILASRLNETMGEQGNKRCKIVERANLKDLLKEADLGDAGITDAATASKAGKILNADALIFGTLNVRQNDERGTKSKPSFDPRSKSYTTKSVPTIRRTVYVAMTFKVVRPESGQIIISKPFEDSYDSGQIESEAGGFDFLGSGGGSGSLLSMDEAAATGVRKCVSQFCGVIAPHVRCFSVELAGGKSELAKSGVELAEQKAFAEAARMFEQAVQGDPEEHTAIYNLGLMKLMLGDLAGAKANIQQAMAIKSDKRYSAAFGKVNELSQSTSKLTFRPATGQEEAECKQLGKTSRKKK